MRTIEGNDGRSINGTPIARRTVIRVVAEIEKDRGLGSTTSEQTFGRCPHSYPEKVAASAKIDPAIKMTSRRSR